MSARAYRSPNRRYRVAPRSRSRGRGSRIDWERAGRIALVLVLFLVVALYINPAAGFIDAWQESKAQRVSLAQEKQANEELKKRLAAISSSEGAEREARRMGMVAADERAYVVRNLREK